MRFFKLQNLSCSNCISCTRALLVQRKGLSSPASCSQNGQPDGSNSKVGERAETNQRTLGIWKIAGNCLSVTEIETVLCPMRLMSVNNFLMKVSEQIRKMGSCRTLCQGNGASTRGSFNKRMYCSYILRLGQNYEALWKRKTVFVNLL